MRRLLSVLALCLMGCASQPSPPPAPPPLPSPGDDVREAAFRYLFQDNASGLKQRARFYCLEVEGGADASPALLARLADVGVRVVPASRCVKDAKDGVTEQPSGDRPGLVFRIEAIRKVGPGRVDVDAGYYEAGLSASGETLEMVREGQAWKVTADRRRWIS